MNIAQKYANLPGALRNGVISNVVNALPGFDTRLNPLRKARRFVAAASLPPVERYLRWVSSFDEAAKQHLYAEGFRPQTAKFLTGSEATCSRFCARLCFPRRRSGADCSSLRWCDS